MEEYRALLQTNGGEDERRYSAPHRLEEGEIILFIDEHALSPAWRVARVAVQPSLAGPGVVICVPAS
jgi:hypothetical protein